MKIIRGLGKFKPKIRNSILSIGVFDGVHLGHQFLIRQVVRRARQLGLNSMVLTFQPHPLKILNSLFSPPLLTSPWHRLILIEKLGVDFCLLVDFDKDLAKMQPEDFVNKIVVAKLKAKEVYVGKGFSFGRKAAGKTELLKRLGKKYNFAVKVVEPLKVDHLLISSSRIRRLIEQGNLILAKKLLGRPFSILGTVVRGRGKGKSLGFPTANLSFCQEALPKSGVYFARVKLAKKNYFALANVGLRPTFIRRKKPLKEGLLRPTIEVHILNFNGKIYRKKIEISFLRRIRSERKFSCAQDLARQIKKDIMQVSSFSDCASTRFRV